MVQLEQHNKLIKVLILISLLVQFEPKSLPALWYQCINQITSTSPYLLGPAATDAAPHDL